MYYTIQFICTVYIYILCTLYSSINIPYTVQFIDIHCTQCWYIIYTVQLTDTFLVHYVIVQFTDIFLVHYVHCTVYRYIPGKLCTLYSLQIHSGYIMYIVQFTDIFLVHFVHCIVYRYIPGILCTLYTVQFTDTFTVHYVHCTLYSKHINSCYNMYTVQFTKTALTQLSIKSTF